MPYVLITTPALPLDVKRALASDLTDAILATLTLSDTERPRTSIHFVSFEPEDCAIGGRLLADGQSPEYTVEVSERNLTPQTKRLLVSAIMPVMVKHLHLDKEPRDADRISIIFRPYVPTDIVIGGRFLPELERNHRTL